MAQLVAPAPHIARQLAEAVALQRQGRLDEAEKLYGRVLKAQRDNFDALHLLGLLQQRRGKPDEARRLIGAALKVNPRSPEALSSYAMVLHTLGRNAEALASLDHALKISPGNLQTLNNRASLLLSLKRAGDALTILDDVLAREPQWMQARANRGNALAELGRHVEALADYETALAMGMRDPVLLYNRGNALRALGRDADAVASYDAAVAAAPSHVNSWYNRGLALQALNRHAEALQSYGQVLALDLNHADAHFSAASAHLTLGNYGAGWPEYEWRWKRIGMAARPRFRQPPWLGETPLDGKTILLHAEQGLGDTIQFARYAPLVARLGGKVLLEVQPELKPLLSRLDGVERVLARGGPVPAFDRHCPLASLPLAFKTELATVPADIPYLRADAMRLDKWRARLESQTAPRVALAWSGSASHVNDRNRSLPLATLTPLLETPGVRFISVQRELREADAAELARHAGVRHLGPELADFADTAAVLALADLVISVDTAVAHLAAALGRPTFVLLPYQPDWRWTLDRDHSPWYPSAELFRQTRPGDWASVLMRLREKLASGALPVT